MTRFVALTLCALVLSSCRNNENNVVLASLNRPAKIQFLCADLDLITGNLYDLREVLPTSLCSTETIFAPEIEAQFLGAVTQIQTGEVAVISFTNNIVLDTNRTVPGVTALRVGEQPTGIQISPFESTYTYVTSFSPKSLQAIETRQLIDGQSLLQPDSVRFEAGPTDVALHESASAVPVTNDDDQVTGADSNVDYRYLYVALPELGQIAQVEVMIDEMTGAQTLGDPILLTLDTYACPVTQVQAPPSDANDYNRICPEDFLDNPGRFIKTVVTTAPCVEGATMGPSPVALTIDQGIEQGSGSGTSTGSDADDVLLVADANQPVIHRFKLDSNGATPMDPIITGTPTTEIDVTPLVPASSDPADQAATQRYLYAVSATDSSVVVVNYTEDPEGTLEEDKEFGAVLPVIAGISARANEENVESRDRVRFAFSNVRAIEVVSPFYTLEEDPDSDGMQVPADEICTSTDSNAFALAQNAANMRGVFLAVSLSDGTMFYLDIYDLNAPCRGGEGGIACTLAETGPDQFASIRRHRRRFGFTPSTFIELDGNPSLQFNASPGRLDETMGAPGSSDGPGLEFINCPPSMDPERSSMFNVFGVPPSGSDADGLICASSQVWSSFSQRWDAQWEGLIPQSEGGLGLFADASFDGTPGNWFLGGDVPFCRVGVLGPQSPDADLVASYVGDRVLITGELPPSTRDELACESFLDLEDDIDERPVWFPIERAFDDQLEIGPSPNPSRYTLDEVRACFNQFTEYEIHTNDVYTVTGTTTGFIHRVVPDENGECVLDDERPVVLDDVDTYLTGRAFEDTQFINPLVSFQIGPYPPETSITDATVALLNFNIANQFTSLVLDTSAGRLSLPSSMLFSARQDQLFFVDFEAGVRRVIFSPLNIAQTFE